MAGDAAAEFDWLTPLIVLVRCGNATPVTLPNQIPVGTQFMVVDNLGIATTSPITIAAQLFGGTPSVQLSTSGGMYRFVWTGAFFTMG